MTSASPIRILIADDHRMVREGLKAFIVPIAEFEVVAEATNGAEAVALAAQTHPDVILLDLMMPVLDGIGATKEICAENPAAHIIIITSFAEDEKIVQALEAGASGYLLKDSSPRELEEAIRSVAAGESSLPPRIAKKLIVRLQQRSQTPKRVVTGRLETPSDPDALTQRECEILTLVGAGLSNEDIAAKLVLSPWTVRSHVSHLMRKLGVENRTQAMLEGLRRGLITAPPK